MVLLHAKGPAEDNQFLHECPADCAIEDISAAVVEIHNLQSKILQLGARLRERFFNLSSPESWTAATFSLYRATSEATTYASKVAGTLLSHHITWNYNTEDQVLHRKCLSLNILRGHMQNIESELSVSPLMESSGADLSQLLSDFDLLNEHMTQLWWAGKQLLKGKRLCNYVGNNEKTKITITLRPVVSDPPPNMSS